MLSEAIKFWDSISGKVRELIRSETQNAMRLERYDVTTAPNGTVMGVTKPFGNNEIFLPYSAEVAGAAVGNPVLVAWWGSMSNAKVYYFANGYRGTSTIPDCFTLLNAASVRAGTISTYENRKITDYQLLVAEWVVDNAVRATATTWRGLFQSANYVSLFYVDSINTQRYCEIVYVSATSVTVRCSQNADGHIYLYGIKNN